MLSLLFLILYGKDGDAKMAALWCDHIMRHKKTFSQVPARLRDRVAELLRDNGCEDLIT